MNISENKLIKIAIIGPECSGKTSLAKALANSIANSLYIPEFARIYANNHKRELTSDDIWPIALGQIDLDKKHLDQYLDHNLGKFLNNNKNNIYIFHDTTLINTRMYANLLYNKKFNKLDALSREQNYDLYFLLDYKDIIWQPEKFQRGYSDQRKVQDQELKLILQEDRINYFNISGDLASRVDIIVDMISDMISDMILDATKNK